MGSPGAPESTELKRLEAGGGAFVAVGTSGLLGSLAALFSGAAWIKPFFYLFAWGFYLLLIGGLNRLASGRSRLIDAPRSRLRLALVSVPWWLFFEALNVRLRNWEYRDLPSPLWVRWPGYALAFATVLPAILETADFFDAVLGKLSPPPPLSPQGERETRHPLALGPAEAMAERATGCLFLLLPMIWPRIFFPLVWGGVFLMLEPLIAREAPERSWLARLRGGAPRRTAALLLSGAACGLLWEFFNYWAGAKWVYTVPWPKGPKLFEMPWLGYAGFLPFALECGSFAEWFELRRRSASPAARASAALLLAMFSLSAFFAIDRWTVRSLVTPW